MDQLCAAGLGKYCSFSKLSVVMCLFGYFGTQDHQRQLQILHYCPHFKSSQFTVHLFDQILYSYFKAAQWNFSFCVDFGVLVD